MAFRYRQKNPKADKHKLSSLFRSYADGQIYLSKEQLISAFEHLGAPLPKMQAQEAMNVADTNNNGYIRCDGVELKNLVDYAYNKGFNASD